MFADDLVARVSLDLFGSCVPRLDVPVLVEGEDGVVLDGLDQEFELGFGALRDALEFDFGPILRHRVPNPIHEDRKLLRAASFLHV